MWALGQNKSPLRLTLTLLPFVVGMVAVSWWLAGMKPSTSLPRAEDYFSSTVFRSGGSTDRVVESLQSHLQAVPGDWQAYSQLGSAYLQKARETGDPTYYQKAERALEEAIAREPEDYASLSLMGALALARHQFLTALELGERAREINPDRAYAYGVIADAQIELGLYEEAAQTLQRMVDLQPDIRSYSRISYLRELHGDTEGAMEMMQRAVDAGSNNLENLAWTRTQLGNLYFNSGNLNRAELEYLRTLEILPDYVYALAGLSKIRYAQGSPEEAITLLSRASDIIPLPEFIIALAELYKATGQAEAAEEQVELMQAIRALYEANGVDMDLEVALFNADREIDIQETLSQTRAAYPRRPGVYAADVLSWVLYKSGNFEEARNYSEQALRLGSQDALKLFHAGMIDYRLGRRAEARNHLKRALEVNPYFSVLYVEEARRTLAELEKSSPDD